MGITDIETAILPNAALESEAMTESENTIGTKKLATIADCAEALLHLSDAEWRRLDEMARLRAIGLKQVDGRDLLHDAIARMLEGKRKWPVDVPLLMFLRETMRSIASDLWRREEDVVVISDSELRVDHEDTSIDLEASANASETLAKIELMFKDDEHAVAVIAGKISGKSPREIQYETEMSVKQYATTLRRIRRRLNKLS